MGFSSAAFCCLQFVRHCSAGKREETLRPTLCAGPKTKGARNARCVLPSHEKESEIKKLVSLPASGLSGGSTPSAGLVGPASAGGGRVDSLLSLEEGLLSEVGGTSLELLLEGRVVVAAVAAAGSLSSLVVVVVLEARVDTSVRLVLLLHRGVGVRHDSLGVSVVSHSVGLSAVSSVLLGIVLVLVLVVAVGVSAAVSTTSAALVLVASGSGVVRAALVPLIVIVRSTVAKVLSHALWVSESTLDASKLLVSTVSVVVSNALLLVPAHGIELMLVRSSVLGSVVKGGVGVGNGAGHAGGNTGGCRGRGIVRGRVCGRIPAARVAGRRGHTGWSLCSVQSLLGKAVAVASEVRLAGLAVLGHARKNGLHSAQVGAPGIVIVHARHDVLLLV
mmetsp:Transcript_27066/g.74301  ORF Transcript_27066/g.74301 Transcript_27066/m.74301 type:complete len:390 (-) Transcript_27066:1756-2925(-)